MAAFSQAQRGELIEVLGECYMTQCTYGAQGSDFNVTAKIFTKALSAYPPEKVITAMRAWVLKSRNFPTPHDIKQMIDPEPVYDRAVYQRIAEKRRSGEILGLSEEDYMRQYERNAMRGV